MIKEEALERYCKKQFLTYSLGDEVLELDGKSYVVVDSDLMVVDENMEVAIPLEDGYDGWVFEFGGRWYIQQYGEVDFLFRELKYIGEPNVQVPTKSFLGIRSGYELMNGIGLYKTWVQKAKFLGITSLGICERNTLSGALAFQKECLANDIKPIFGITVPVEGKDNFDMKFYAKDFQGWQNLLKFNTQINVDGKMAISQSYIKDNLEGLFCVADPKSMNFEEVPDFVDYYQLDTPNYLNTDTDYEYVLNFEKFLTSDLEPINISDAFYLEQDEFLARESLWKIDKSFDDKTNNQYFKNNQEKAIEFLLRFEKGKDYWKTIFKKANANEEFLVENCNFTYDTDTRHLPKYKMTEDEKSKFDTNEELFLYLIKKGFKEKNFKEPKKYIDRLKKEIEVLKMGDVIDYFLGLYDIIRHSKEQGFLTGIGRGSAGGSLVAYLLGIIQIDPLEFDLLFERFLNSGRMGEWEDRPLYSVEMDDGKVVDFAEGSLIRVLRNSKETVVFIQDLVEGDEILRY